MDTRLCFHDDKERVIYNDLTTTLARVTTARGGVGHGREGAFLYLSNNFTLSALC